MQCKQWIVGVGDDGDEYSRNCCLYYQLEEVLMEADVGDNYAMDPAIQEACEPIVRVLCKDVSPGEGRSA